MIDASHCQPPLYSSFLSQVSGPPRKFGCIHGFAAIYRHHWHKWEAFLFIFKISLALPSVFFTEVQSHRVIQIEYRKICMAFHNVLLQVGGLISLRRMIAVDFTVLSGTSAPYFKLSDAWLSISSEKSLLHVSLMPWQWWRGQFSKCTFQFIKKCFLGLHHYNILFDMLQQNCHSTVNSFHS